MYNWSRLGLVAGVLICTNLMSWVGPLLPTGPGRGWPGWTARLGLGVLLLGWIVAILTGVYPKWVDRAFGFGETALLFPHDAARFAGQPDMPPRSVAFPLEAASLSIYHEAPGHGTFTDPRLELPAPKTFQTYLSIWKMLNEGNARGVAALHDLEAPVVLIVHADNARVEATLLTDPNWRLVYLDALAAVFLARSDPALEARFPTLDLGARHFAQPQARSVPDTSGAAGKEAQALFDLEMALRPAAAARWHLRIPILLAALDRAEAALQDEPARAATWLLLSSCHWSLLPELRGPPRAALQGWDPETGLAWAQATYCVRRGLEGAPDDVALLRTLFRSYAARDLVDAQDEVAERLRGLNQPVPWSERGSLPGRGAFDPGPLPREPTPEQLPLLLAQLLDNHQPATALRLVEQPLARGEAVWDWPLADRLAGASLHLGRPALARQVWQRAKAPPAEAVRHSRLGDACWVERDFESAIAHYQKARRLDPQLVEPCWALAYLYAERGQAAPALLACREGLSRALPLNLRDELKALEELLEGNSSSTIPRENQP
jgi:tetratricopeptide (TPR) repeat protein